MVVAGHVRFAMWAEQHAHNAHNTNRVFVLELEEGLSVRGRGCWDSCGQRKRHNFSVSEQTGGAFVTPLTMTVVDRFE